MIVVVSRSCHFRSRTYCYEAATCGTRTGYLDLCSTRATTQKSYRASVHCRPNVSDLILSINRMIVVLCLGLFVACAVAGSCYITWQTEIVRDTSYIQLSDAERDRSSFVAFIQMMVYYFLLLYQVIPISLNVSMTSVKFLQSRFMSWDLEMYHTETDTPAIVQMME